MSRFSFAWLEIFNLGPKLENTQLNILEDNFNPKILVIIKRFIPRIASKRYLIVLILIIGLLYNIFSTNFLLINIYMEN